MPLNLLWTRSFYFLLFLFKYDTVLIKQPSSCSFGGQNCKILKNFKDF